MGFFSRSKKDPSTNGQNPEQPGKKAEILPPFRATPEALSQVLEMKTDEVEAQLKSVEGRKDLFDKLMEHEDKIKQVHDFKPEDLRRQLEVTGEAVGAKERFMADAQSPEKKGLFRRAWEKVKAFPRKHPIVTALLVITALAGATAAGFYLTGNWELLMSKAAGLRKVLQALKAPEELIPPMPNTPPLPGGGVFEIPGGTPTPGLDIPT
ncbi:MAG: hypothetical protein AAB728_05520 [Patescibacteria group bacterium]|mgnify:CR=1 FL=1